MASSSEASTAGGKVAAAGPTPDSGNPAFRALGLPKISRFKLPSRNWLIFLGVAGSWTGALLYDRFETRKVKRKWCQCVSHLATEPIAPNSLQRRITILLAAPPGDGLRAAREHFHDYVKPILVAGAMDWDVIEGRREGEVRAGLAERIRSLRRRQGETCSAETLEDHLTEESEAAEREASLDALRAVRKVMGVQEWDGVRGDLIIGRHTWKEYVRGLHEGWLGPLKAPPRRKQSREFIASKESTSQDSISPVAEPAAQSDYVAPGPQSEEPRLDTSMELNEEDKPGTNATATETGKESSEPQKAPGKKKSAAHTRPFIEPEEYHDAIMSSHIPHVLGPSIALPLPHILGFFNTPKRMYRFLTRRLLADETGERVAAIVLAHKTRPFKQDGIETENADTQDTSTTEVVALLKPAEAEWHKSVWKDKSSDKGTDDVEEVWKSPMVVDSRICQRMRMFELPEGAAAQAKRLSDEKDKAKPGLWTIATEWLGYGPQPKPGWEMGPENSETE